MAYSKTGNHPAFVYRDNRFAMIHVGTATGAAARNSARGRIPAHAAGLGPGSALYAVHVGQRFFAQGEPPQVYSFSFHDENLITSY